MILLRVLGEGNGTNLCRRVDHCQVVAIEQRAAEGRQESCCQERLCEMLQEQKKRVRWQKQMVG